MAYPTDLNPTLKTDWANNTPVEDTHPDEHNNVALDVTALKAKVGADGSAVTTSHDYKLGEVTSTDRAVGKTATQILTNKTLTSPVLTTPRLANGGYIADANGNELIEATTTASATNHVGITNNSTGNDPLIEAKGSDTNISLKIKGKGSGKVKLGAVDLQFPNVDGSANQILKTDGSGVLSWTNQTTVDSNLIPQSTYFSNITGSSSELIYNQYCDANQFALASRTATTIYYVNSGVTGGFQTRDVTSDWATAAEITSCITLGAYLYLLLRDASNNYRVYRYGVGTLSSGGTLMTISGQAFATTGGANVIMTSNGTNFYFNYKAGNNASDRIISKYTISGTTLTYSSDITCGASSNVCNQIIQVDSSDNIYGWYRSADFGGDNKIRKYNSSGTLQYTSPAYGGSQIWRTVFTFGTISYINYTVSTNPWYYLIRIFL